MLLSKLRTSGFKKYSVNIHGCLLDNPCLSPINHARMIVKGNAPRRYSVHLKQQGLSSAAGKRLNGIINKPDRCDGFWTRTVTALGQAKQGLSAADIATRLFRSRDESRIRKKNLLKLSSDTDRSFAAKMMCVLNIISDVGKIFFLELITIT